MMTGNHMLELRDHSGAIMRRIRPFKISKVPKERLHLLSKDQKGNWNGHLATELSGILTQVVLTPGEYVERYVRDFHMVPAFRDCVEETADDGRGLRFRVLLILKGTQIHQSTPLPLERKDYTFTEGDSTEARSRGKL